MPKRIQVANFTDFTGGLNLRADPFQLAPNESPDLLNVDVDPRGGFTQRKVVRPMNPNVALPAAPTSLWEYATATGTRQIMASAGSGLYRSTGGEFTQLAGITQTAGRYHSAATFKDRCYIQNGIDKPIRWDGSTATRLDGFWNDNLEAPAGVNMPIARYVTAHMGVMWVAYTKEGDGEHPNRVRFSHPNFPDNWRQFDVIEVDTGTDGDYITGLVPFGDHLLVFKRSSVYAIFGYSPETFQVQPIDRTVGAANPAAIASTENGVYFFHWPKGVFRYSGKGQPDWLFDRLLPAITDGDIPDAGADKIAMGWFRRRLYVSVPWGASSTNARTFVYDATIGKAGGWTLYDLPLGSFLEWNPPGQDALLLAGLSSAGRVVKMEQSGTTDDLGSGDVHVTSYYTTRWLDLGQPALQKRWKRPEVVLRGGGDATLGVEVYADYDPTNIAKRFNIHTTADREAPAPPPSQSTPVDSTEPEALVWGEGQWGVGKWGAGYLPDSGSGGEGAEGFYNVVKRGGPLGTARAVRLRFQGPSTDIPWSVDAFMLKYIPKRIRS